MGTITTQDGTTIFYKDWGPKDAQALVFHHGWPLSADDWDAQMLFFRERGYRVIAHDRRGHGRSSQPWQGNDMDTYAADADEDEAEDILHRVAERAVVGDQVLLEDQVSTVMSVSRASLVAASRYEPAPRFGR